MSSDKEYEELLHKYKFRQEEWNLYKPSKKYYSNQLAKPTDHREYLKRFSNYQDLPRASIMMYGMHKQQEFITTYMLLGTMFAFVGGRIFANEYYGIQNTPHRISRCRYGCYALYLAVGVIMIPTKVMYTPQNSGIFTPVFYEKKVQRDLDLKLDLYRNVHLIQNSDEEPTWQEYMDVNNRVMDRALSQIPITYSSLIVMNLSAFPSIALYSDGFTSQNFSLRSFHAFEGTLFHDYQNCVFRILPVMNYKSIDILLEQVASDDFEQIKMEDSLKTRKQLIQTLHLNLENELSSNISLTNKLMGTPLVFSSSTFHLVHLPSMKFVALDDENLEGLQFKMVDFPNENTVLKFNPCLNFQKLRTNVVYHGDVVCLSAAKQVCNRSANLFSTYWGIYYYQLKDEAEKYNVEVQQAKVQASVEEATQWRINIFQSRKENDDDLFVGDVIVMNMPEANMLLNAKRSKDLFEKVQGMLDVQVPGSEQNIFQQRSLFNRQATQLLLPQQTLGAAGGPISRQMSNSGEEQPGSDHRSDFEKQRSWQSRGSRKSVARVSKDLQELKLLLNEDLKVVFDMQEIKNDSIVIPYSAYWRIEAENMHGGQVVWDKCYRIRHFQTGKYLEITTQKKPRLTQQITRSTLFYFVPMKKSSKYITKDSYFHLKHLLTQCYLDQQGDSLGCVSESHNQYVFKFRKADFEDMWETRFLLFCVPLVTEAISFFENQKQMSTTIVKNEDVRERLAFYSLYHRLNSMLDVLHQFIHNKLISNIQKAQDFSFVSPSRQNIIRDECVMPLLMLLLVKSYPMQWESVDLSISQIQVDLCGEHSFICRIEALVREQALSGKLMERLEDNHRKRKLLLSHKLYETIQAICYDNPVNQGKFMEFFPHFERNICKGYVANSLIAVLSKNYDLQCQFGRSGRINQVITLMSNQSDTQLSPELLQLLANSCSANEEPIFANQELLMNLLITEERISRKLLMVISGNTDDLMLTYRDKNGVACTRSLKVFLADVKVEYHPQLSLQYKYLIQQLSLYANLCFHRNTQARAYFSKRFPYDQLIQYALDDQIDDGIRAQFCRMIRNMYIDREPYTTTPKPELVRILDPIPVTKKLFLYQGFHSEKGEQTEYDIIGLRSKLLHYLETKYHVLMQSDKSEDVYSLLTLEVIKILEMMLRFELFQTKKQENKLRFNSRKTGFFESKAAHQNIAESDIDHLITYLALMLEYDQQYFKCMKEGAIERAYNVKEIKQSNLLDIGNIGNVFNSTSNGNNKHNTKIESKRGILRAQESDVISDPLFKKLKSLRKVLSKYTNKTFTLRENKELDYETLIKVQICQVFSYLMDVSQDYMIDNALAYYKQKQSDYEFIRLFPDSSLCCGESFKSTVREYFAEEPYLKSFDEVLRRPFIEVLLLALYFTRNPQLENQLVDIIQRFSRQKKEFLQHFENVQILDQSEQQQLYSVWIMIIQSLKNSIEYSQTWITKDCAIMDDTLQGLWKIDSIFQQSEQISLKLKQQIFEHIGGYQVLIELIDKSLSVIDVNLLTDKLMKILRLVLNIMSYYAMDNEANSLQVYKRVVKQVILYTDHNIGQVGLLSSLFSGKPTLFGQLSTQEYEYFVQLIGQHGHYHEFLEFYEQILTVAEQYSKNIDMHKQVMETLTNPATYHLLTPFVDSRYSQFYDYPPNADKYRTKYLKLVSQCLQRNIGVSLVSQAAQLLNVNDLLKYTKYLTESVLETIVQRDQPTELIIKTKKYVWNLLKLMFENSIECIEALLKDSTIFFQVLDMEYQGITIQELFKPAELDYFFDSLLPVINMYHERLQDALVNSDSQQERMYKFVEFFLKNLDRMFFMAPNELLANRKRMKTITELQKGFNIQLPTHLLEEDELLPIMDTAKVQKTQESQHIGNAGLLGFRQEFLCCDEVKELVKLESSYLSKSIWNIDSMFNTAVNDVSDLLLVNEDIIVKILGYLQFWRTNGASRESVMFILKVLSAILKDASKVGDEELLQRQNLFDRMNVTQIILVLLYESELEPGYMSTLNKFLILLLKNGNAQVQKTAYDFFLSSTSCEKLFVQFSNVLNMQIQSQNRAHKLNAQENKLVCKTLQILQLFCEGHNQDMQNYLRNQYNQKNSIDLITMTVALLNSFQISNDNYESVLQCLETLNETIQGPCRQNQVTLMKSTFLEFAVQVLEEDDRIFDCNGEHNRPGYDKYIISLHPGQLARIKFKCLNAIVSLLECNESQDSLMMRIIRTIPLTVLTNNLSRIYALFTKFEDNQYKIDVFQRNEIDITKEFPEDYYELIIENGFSIFMLMQLFLNNQKAKDLLYEDTEMSDVLNEFSNDQEDQDKNILTSLFKGNIFGEFAKIGGDIMDLLKEGIKSEEQIKLEKQLEEKKRQKELTKNAVKFFRENTCSIDMVREDNLYTVYFPRLPICKLPKQAKTEFHSKVDRTSSKTKLTTLMEGADELIKIMEHEETLNQLFAVNPVFGFFATHGKLWEQCAFVTTLMINFVVCASYSQFYYNPATQDLSAERLSDARLFFLEELIWTPILINVLGIIMLVFSSLIVFFFIVKRAPLKISDIWESFLKNPPTSRFRKVMRFSYLTVISLVKLLQDVDILYYSIYIIAGIVGLTVHPFFFASHLMDFLKLEQLSTVVEAIWYPRKELGLAMLLLVITEYYVGIIGYVIFYEDYGIVDQESGRRACSSLWECIFTSFDQTFKATGALGAGLLDIDTIKYIAETEFSYVQDPEDRKALSADEYNGTDHQFTSEYLQRFVFDNAINIILVMILLNMIQGIIIDTFGSLREQQKERKDDQTLKCYICGITREKFEKNDGLGFTQHVKLEHYMWNYVYYKAYLDHKDENDYNGNESYIYHKIEAKDISWLPIKRARLIEEENDEQENMDILNKVDGQMKVINEKLEKTQIRVSHLIELMKTHK